MKQKYQFVIVDNSETPHRNSDDHDYTMTKTQIYNEELRDIVFAVSALTMENWIMKTKKSGRITIVLDDDLLKKLRERQSKLIRKSICSVSFSKVLNDVLRECLTKA